MVLHIGRASHERAGLEVVRARRNRRAGVR